MYSKTSLCRISIHRGDLFDISNFEIPDVHVDKVIAPRAVGHGNTAWLKRA